MHYCHYQPAHSHVAAVYSANADANLADTETNKR